MKGFISFTLKFLAVMAVVAAVAYWLNYFLAAAGKKICLKDILPKKEADEKVIEAPTSASCGCNDAVCAVDMCMPY